VSFHDLHDLEAGSVGLLIGVLALLRGGGS
jgi:hypothetical protein